MITDILTPSGSSCDIFSLPVLLSIPEPSPGRNLAVHFYGLRAFHRVDICTRYSSMQYLITPFEPIETEIPNIMERIFLQYYRQCGDHDFHPTYEYLSMADETVSK